MMRISTKALSLSVADEATEWDASEARKRIFERAKFDSDEPDVDYAKKAFLLYDDENETIRSSYKLPVADIINDKLQIVPRAVYAAAAAVNGARGGIDVDADIREELKNVLNKLYKKLDKPSPFEKTLKIFDNGYRMQGYGVVFGGKDLEGETFTEETDFWFDKLKLTTYPVLYDHGQHTWIKDTVIGQAKVHKDEFGIWLDIELSRADEYRAYVELVKTLAQHKALGISSGAVAHLVKRENSVIKQWPIAEFSLTPTPAEPRTIGVSLVKSVNTLLYDNVVVQSAQTEDETKQSESEKETMQETVENTEQEVYNQEQEQRKEQNNMLYATSETTKTFKDFIYAVAKRDKEALKAMSVKDVLESGTGGYLVPEQFVAQLMQLNDTSLGELLQRTMQIRNPSSNIVNVPALNHATGGTFGGITVGIVGEGVAKPETDPIFAQISVQLYKLAGITQVSDELLADSSISVAQLLTQLFRNAMLSKAEQLLLTGTGTNEPLGILHSSNTALVTVTRATVGNIEVADIANMYSRQINPANAVWIASPTVLPELLSFNTSIIAWARDLVGPIPAQLFGRPLIITRHAPTLANAGTISFVDMSHVVTAYTDPVVQSSQDYAFAQDLTTWRFVMRFGARPNVNAVVGTGADAMSAFVQISA